MNRNINSTQFSPYDERPDPKNPGQQGVLFRKLAPAREGEGSQKQGFRQPEKNPSTGYANGYVNPHELYHGTVDNSLRVGRMVRPGRQQNWPSQTKDYNSEHVFTTNELDSAYHFAMRASTMTGKRPAIFTVRPTGPLQVDEEDRPDPEYGHQYDEDTGETYWDTPTHFQSKKPMRVTGRVPLPEARAEYEGINGTHVQSWLR